jgi:hypothetical protein
MFPLFRLSEGRKTRVSSGRCQQCRAAPWVALLSLRGHSGRLGQANSTPEQQTAGKKTLSDSRANGTFKVAT